MNENKITIVGIKVKVYMKVELYTYADDKKNNQKNKSLIDCFLHSQIVLIEKTTIESKLY
jgi:hypothetical protein